TIAHVAWHLQAGRNKQFRQNPGWDGGRYGVMIAPSGGSTVVGASACIDGGVCGMARIACRFLAVAILVVAGCQAGPRPVAVKGRVLYRDWPRAHALIVFSPDSSRGSSGPMARAEIQAGGFYNLRDQGGQSVPAGWYRVTVASIEADGIGPGR